METIQQLRELRASLPLGKKDPWGQCCKSKRILIQRALKRDKVEDLTAGEKTVVEEFLAHYNQVMKENNKLQRAILKVTQS